MAFVMSLTLNMPEELHLYGLCVYYVVHICDFGTSSGNFNWCVFIKSHDRILTHDIVSWEPEGRYHYSKMFHWEPEGHYIIIDFVQW